jgi:hypothetical protein
VGLFLVVVVLGLDLLLLLLLLDYQSSLLSGRRRRGHCCEIGSLELTIASMQLSATAGEHGCCLRIVYVRCNAAVIFQKGLAN